MYVTNMYVMIKRIVMTQPMISIGLQENAFPMAKVAVIKAVFGKTKEYQVIEKTNRSFPTMERWAKTAMRKKKIARLWRRMSVVVIGKGNKVSSPPEPQSCKVSKDLDDGCC
jgi:hypothetical protein